MDKFLFKCFVILILGICHQAYAYSIYDDKGNGTEYDNSNEYDNRTEFNRTEHGKKTVYGKKAEDSDKLTNLYKKYQSILRSNLFNMTTPDVFKMDAPDQDTILYCSKYNGDCQACKREEKCYFCSNGDNCFAESPFGLRSCYLDIPCTTKSRGFRFHFIIVPIGLFKGGLCYYCHRRRRKRINAERLRAFQAANMESPVTNDSNIPREINLEVTQSLDSAPAVKHVSNGFPYTKFS